MVFACIFHWAFPWKPYDLEHQLRGPNRLEEYACSPNVALLEALNPWDYAKAAARGFRWLFHGVRHRKNDISYQNRLQAEKDAEAVVKPTTPTRDARTSALSDPGPSRRTRGRGKSGSTNRHTIG